jgi:hypothetical protein
MKRIVFLMLVISIACAGCEVKESSTSRIMGPIEQPVRTDERHELPIVTHEQIVGFQGVAINITDLQRRIEIVEEELSQIKIAPRPDKVLLARITEHGAELESQKEELRENIAKLKEDLSEAKITPKPDKTLLVRIANLETALESQKEELRADITKLKEDLSETKITPKPDKTLLIRITNLETALESQRVELRENITKLKEGLPKSEGTSGGGWWTSVAIATIISTLIAGSVAVHRSRKVRRMYLR